MESMLFHCLEVHGHRDAGSQLRRTKQLNVVPVLCLIASGSGTPRLPPQGNEELDTLATRP
jgi:hypothetical protein